MKMSSTSGGDLTNTKVIVQKKFNQNNPENVNSPQVKPGGGNIIHISGLPQN